MGDWLAQRIGPGRKPLVLAIALGEASGILLVLQTALLAEVGSALIEGRPAAGSLAALLAAFPAVIAARAAATWGGRRAASDCAAAAKRALRAGLTAHLRALGPIALAAMRAGTTANTVVDGVEALDPYYSKYLPQRAIATLLPFTILAVVFPFDWVSGLVLVLTAAFLPLSLIVVGAEAHQRSQRVWAKLAEISGRFLDVLQGLATLRMFDAARREAREIARDSEEYRQASMSALRMAFVSSFALELISASAIAIIAVVCGFRLLAASMPFRPGYFVLLVAPEYFLTLRSLGTYYHARMEAVAAAEQVAALLATRPAGAPQTAAPARPRAVGARPPAVIFDRVAFAYEREAVLRSVSFAVGAGEHVALRGRSGAGKSTVLSLLLGFCSPQAGRVLIDGEPLEDLDREAWLRRVAWLPQRPTIFHGTILENIRLGRLDASDREVERAAAAAGADGFAGRLGLYTAVGEMGQGLSVGEAQRVALARLLLREPDVVLLDEPTAHLDAESGRLVGQAVREWTRGRTMIVATHEEAATGALDRTLLIERGRMIEGDIA